MKTAINQIIMSNTGDSIIHAIALVYEYLIFFMKYIIITNLVLQKRRY